MGKTLDCGMFKYIEETGWPLKQRKPLYAVALQWLLREEQGPLLFAFPAINL